MTYYDLLNTIEPLSLTQIEFVLESVKQWVKEDLKAIDKSGKRVDVKLVCENGSLLKRLAI
jgi:hypothetical protein